MSANNFTKLNLKDVKKLMVKNKFNFYAKEYDFVLYIHPHEFRRGSLKCIEHMDNLLGKRIPELKGYVIYYGIIKVQRMAVVKDLQGGVHIRAKVPVVLFKASSVHPFITIINSFDERYVYGETCGIGTRIKIDKNTEFVNIGDELKVVSLGHKEQEGIWVLECTVKP